jgi:hypothetical protein
VKFRVLALAAATLAAPAVHAAASANATFGTATPVQLISLTGAFAPRPAPESDLIAPGQALQYSVDYTLTVSDQGLPAVETRMGEDFGPTGFFAGELNPSAHGPHGTFISFTGREIAIANLIAMPTCGPCSEFLYFAASSTAPTLLVTPADNQADFLTVSGTLTLTSGVQTFADHPDIVHFQEIRTQLYSLSSPIPEPSSAGLTAAGLLLFLLGSRATRRPRCCRW